MTTHTHARFLLTACALGALVIISSAACNTSAEPASGNPPATSASTGASASTPTAAAANGLTPFQLEHGIGPITSPVTLGEIDKAMAKQGHEVFEHKCAACHKMDERYVGPALGEVTKRRSPAFIMNMALNPQGMVEKHPVTKKLLAEFFTAMPNQQISQDQARQVVEYLRTQSKSH
jgi:cytochrome c